PGVKEYESWLESRMLNFEAAEDARLAAEQAKRNAEIERRAAAAQRAEQARAAQARKPRGGVRTPPRLPPEPVETPAFDVASLPPLPDTYTTKPKPPREAPSTAATPSPPKPKQTAASAQGTTRGRAYWSKKIARRDPPRRAADVVPRLEAVFRDSGLPPQLVWLAEVESSMDPAAKSPAGAVGLFQLMPATARSLGLATSPKDQRLDPEKNARAAATYLKALHRRFGSWPLALAAYNAGEGKVSGLCRRRGTRAFDDIADALPTETQMYVPRVLETIRARTGADPDALPPPRT
ncbi:MAG: lytic transglycosylase domain-containing protein, partial [Kiritimatiellae bacterium]|nr:lytic transglycosylase domain-containing protein [Kiritimatiellia bacterium]